MVSQHFDTNLASRRHMFPSDTTRTRGVVARDRFDQTPMLFDGDCAAAVLGEGGTWKASNPMVDLFNHVEEKDVSGCVRQSFMETKVEDNQSVKVRCIYGIGELVVDVNQRRDIGWVGVEGSEFGCQPIHRLSDNVNVDDFLRGDVTGNQSTTGDSLGEPFGFQSEESLANRGPAHVERASQVLFTKAFAGGDGARDQRLSQDLVNHVGRGTITSLSFPELSECVHGFSRRLCQDTLHSRIASDERPPGE